MGKVSRTAHICGSGLLVAALTAGLAAASPAAAVSPAAVLKPAIARTGPAMSSVLAAEAMARAHAAQAKRPGIISGVVRSLAGGHVGSCVTVVGKDSHAIVRAGAGGRYVLGGLRPGRYLVSATACANAGQAARRALIGASWATDPATVTVRAGQVSNPAPMSLWYIGKNRLTGPKDQAMPAAAGARSRFGSISGVVSGRGRPQRGVCAFALSFNGSAPAFAITGKSGAYRIGKLRPGQYAVTFLAGIKHCANNGNWLQQWYPDVTSPFLSSHVKFLRVRAGKAIKGIDAKLKAGGELAGTVRATSGKPIPGICVFVVGEIDRGRAVTFANLITGKAGRYTLHGAFAGRYQAEFFIGCGTTGNYAFQWWRRATSENHASTIRISGTQKVTDINPTLRRGAIVSGVVKAVNARGKPISGVCVTAVGTSDFNPDAAANSHDDGSYRVEGLAAGRYQIQFDPSCIGNGNSPFLFLQRNVTVAAGQTVTGFNAFLARAGGISGLVTDPAGRPVGGVCVQVFDDNGDATISRPDGKYSIAGVIPGSYPVRFSGGCGNSGSLAPEFYHQPQNSQIGTPIRFRPNTTIPNINAAMLPGGTLAGVVRNTAGRRLSGICVNIDSADQTGPPGFGSFFATTHRGRYLIANLPPSPYDISFGCGGYGTQYYPAQPGFATSSLVAVNAGVTTRVSARLSRAGGITGTVTRKGGTPLASACVEAVPEGTGSLSMSIAFTNQKGRYRLGGLAPGRYLVQFSDCTDKGRFGSQWYRRKMRESAATPVGVIAGQTVRGINALVTAGGSITGRVTGPSGRPAREICVFALSSAAQAAAGQTDAFGQTGKSGRYRLHGLSTGRWSLEFVPCFTRPHLGGVTLSGIRVTAPHTHAGVNLRMPAGGSISGTIVSRSGAGPISGVCVQALPVRPNDSPGSFGVTGGRGHYFAADLAPGKYHVYFSDGACGAFSETNVPFAPQWYRHQPAEAAAATVRVSAGGAVTGINDALSLFGAVTGTVETGGHAAVAGECVTAVPFRSPPDPMFGTPAQPEVAVTGRTGNYTLTQLTPGRYKIEFSTGCGGLHSATQWWDNAGSARTAKVITVKFAVISGIDATLRR